MFYKFSKACIELAKLMDISIQARLVFFRRTNIIINSLARSSAISNQLNKLVGSYTAQSKPELGRSLASHPPHPSLICMRQEPYNWFQGHLKEGKVDIYRIPVEFK